MSFLGLIGLYKSNDGGNTWTFASSSTGNGFHTDFHYVTVNGSTVWAVNDGGVTVSTDGGTTWDNKSNLGLTTFQAQSVSLTPSGDSVALIGGQDNGVDVYNGNPTWSSSQQYGDGGITAIDPANPSIMFGTAFQFYLGRSRTGLTPDSLESIDPPVPQGEGVQFYAPYILDPSDPDRLVFGTNRIWETCALTPSLSCNATTGSPPSWNVISPALNPGCQFTSEDGTLNLCNVSGIAIAQSDSAVLYAITSSDFGIGPFAWVSTNSNTATPTFTSISAGLPAGAGLTSVSIAPDAPDTAIVSVQGFTGGGSHIFRTTNFGATWSDISGLATGYPDLPTLKVLYDPFDATGNTIYAGTTQGVLVTNDGGSSWANFNNNSLPNVQVFNLARNASVLAAATHGRGIWVMQAPVVRTPTPTPTKKTPTPTPTRTATKPAVTSTPTTKPTPTATATIIAGTPHISSINSGTPGVIFVGGSFQYHRHWLHRRIAGEFLRRHFNRRTQFPDDSYVS